MVHSLVPPSHRHKRDGINWLGHTTQTRLALACRQTCVDWRKFPEHSTTPFRGSPMSYRSMFPAPLPSLPWYSGRIGRHIPRSRSLQFLKHVGLINCYTWGLSYREISKTFATNLKINQISSQPTNYPLSQRNLRPILLLWRTSLLVILDTVIWHDKLFVKLGTLY